MNYKMNLLCMGLLFFSNYLVAEKTETFKFTESAPNSKGTSTIQSSSGLQGTKTIDYSTGEITKTGPKGESINRTPETQYGDETLFTGPKEHSATLDVDYEAGTATVTGPGDQEDTGTFTTTDSGDTTTNTFVDSEGNKVSKSYTFESDGSEEVQINVTQEY